jgi:hypothetical protein
MGGIPKRPFDKPSFPPSSSSSSSSSSSASSSSSSSLIAEITTGGPDRGQNLEQVSKKRRLVKGKEETGKGEKALTLEEKKMQILRRRGYRGRNPWKSLQRDLWYQFCKYIEKTLVFYSTRDFHLNVPRPGGGTNWRGARGSYGIDSTTDAAIFTLSFQGLVMSGDVLLRVVAKIFRYIGLVDIVEQDGNWKQQVKNIMDFLGFSNIFSESKQETPGICSVFVLQSYRSPTLHRFYRFLLVNLFYFIFKFEAEDSLQFRQMLQTMHELDIGVSLQIARENFPLNPHIYEFKFNPQGQIYGLNSETGRPEVPRFVDKATRAKAEMEEILPRGIIPPLQNIILDYIYP